MLVHAQKCSLGNMTHRFVTVRSGYNIPGHRAQEERPGWNTWESPSMMTWGGGPHSSNVTNKTKRTLGFIRINVKIADKKTKESQQSLRQASRGICKPRLGPLPFRQTTPTHWKKYNEGLVDVYYIDTAKPPVLTRCWCDPKMNKTNRGKIQAVIADTKIGNDVNITCILIYILILIHLVVVSICFGK